VHYSGTLSCVLDWDRINLENYYSLYITKQIKTERTIKPAVITNMTSVLVRPKIIVYLIQIPNCKAMITVPPSLGLGKENGTFGLECLLFLGAFYRHNFC